MRKIFIVTGANGFLGNNIVRELVKKNEDSEIRALVHKGSTKPNALEGLPCKIYEGDVTDISSLAEVFSAPKDAKLYVIHAAGIVTIKAKNDSTVYKTNVEGTKNIVEKALETHAKLVYISSVHAIPAKPYGEKIVEIDTFDPKAVDGIYAETKAVAANYILDAVKNRGLDASILHPSGLIGPNDFGLTHLTKLIRDIANGDFRIMVHGGYDFVDARDVASDAVSACENGKPGECYILANQVFSIKETADLVCKIMGYKNIKVTIPMFLCKMFAPLCEVYYNIKKVPPLFTRLSLRVITSNGNFDTSKARSVLGFNPRPFEKTIRDTVQFMIDQGVVTTKKKLLLKENMKEVLT